MLTEFSCPGHPTPLFSGGFHRPGTLFRVKDTANDKLFSAMPADIKRLNEKAKKERRQKEREEYAKANGLKPVV